MNNITISTENYDYTTLYNVSEYILRELMPKEAKKGRKEIVYFLNDLYLGLCKELKQFIEED